MKIFRKAGQLHQYLLQAKKQGRRISFVPTMGALHNGHIELISQARQASDITVCSIFVNPTQFNNQEDFAKYPKTIAQDIGMLEAAGNNIAFVPDVSEIYPSESSKKEYFDLGYLETTLEGSSRPGHFQGVCMVMKRLLTIVDPHLLFMGQKDYQQCMIVSRLIGLMGSQAKLITAPTVRQPDGLAMSSRNKRLSEGGLLRASEISKAMTAIRKALQPGRLDKLKEGAKKLLESKGFTVDYVEIASAETLELRDTWDGNEKLVCLVAAFIEEVRLIDNLLLN